VVSESLARFIAGDGSALGRRLAGWPPYKEPIAYLEIVGVVPDLISYVNDTAPLTAYVSTAQRPAALGADLVLRAAGDSRATMREVLATVRELDPRVSPERMLTLDVQIDRQMGPQRFGVYVLTALGGMALLLTVLGTYVIAQSTVVRRRRELGIRAALGARSTHLHRLVLGDTARLVGTGLIAGLALAAAGARSIRSLLYQVQPLDPLVLVTVAAGIFGLALLVSLRPAREAGRVDLNRTSREE
ncbi:MAG TPA: FtsX-like permease family protein, partial [Gammaproteobacteria bacterium]|nr:FtsX-like permease family protein [Gammaproteobacteria bacterium]